MSYSLLIDGRKVQGVGRIDVIDPSTGSVFDSAPRADEALALEAIAASSKAGKLWAALGYAGRRVYLHDFATAIESRTEEMAAVLNRERGGPLAECRREVAITVAALRHFADQSLASRVVRESDVERIIEQHYPQGVVAAIMPWNRPITLLSFKLGPALITGNTVIAKPAPTTPLSTLLIGEIAADVLPAGVFQTLADQNDLGALLTRHPSVAHVSFTGSTATGKKVLAGAADSLKRFTLELGGNDVAIILDDADLESVIPKIFQAAMINAGQVCYATKRVYAPRPMLDRVVELLADQAKGARLGNGLDPAHQIGPLQNRMQFEKVLTLIEVTRKEGTIVVGGDVVEGGGYFITPAIVRDLSDDAQLVREEQFGPILPVLGYDDLDSVVDRANASEYGLGGSIWTADVKRGIDIASRIESGTVWVNRHMSLPFDVAFGGAKESGMGLQNGVQGMEDFTQRRIVNVALD
ncbi:aldehyde dehydrogenase family protein [Pseudomonas graminis]|uniref:aldehyde dehydrogenase family protein n=1 Tax=Pseudomonas graminis TaxID=158627 RepID=UPI0023490B9B|nr:aldehyde dehydrogenase family protein [Pseudomonas graminis]MDC6379839.1 aldehyde dehydrogenase family protein [Pseudomonas graminis]